MPEAYVLFNVGPGCEGQVLKDVNETGAVAQAFISYGVYDLIVKVKASTMEELKELVSYKLRKIENVRATLTLILTQ